MGACGVATAGLHGSAAAGEGGTIIIRYFEADTERYRIAVGYIGEGGIKPDVAYIVRHGRLVPAP